MNNDCDQTSVILNKLLLIFVGTLIGVCVSAFTHGGGNRDALIAHGVAHYDLKTGEFIEHELPKDKE